jgi:hypothetical protein
MRYDACRKVLESPPPECDAETTKRLRRWVEQIDHLCEKGNSSTEDTESTEN